MILKREEGGDACDDIEGEFSGEALQEGVKQGKGGNIPSSLRGGGFLHVCAGAHCACAIRHSRTLNTSRARMRVGARVCV